MTLENDYERDYQRQHRINEQAKLDAARPALPTPYFVGVGFDGMPVSWGQTAHYAESCADSAVSEVLPASAAAINCFLHGRKINIINNRAYAPSEVSA